MAIGPSNNSKSTTTGEGTPLLNAEQRYSKTMVNQRTSPPPSNETIQLEQRQPRNGVSPRNSNPYNHVPTGDGEDAFGDEGPELSNANKSWCCSRSAIPLLVAVPFFVSSLAILGISFRGYRLGLPGHSASVPMSTPALNVRFYGESHAENEANALKIRQYGEFLGSTVDGLSQAAVASDHPLCSRVGSSILREKGGNAVDAAVATALCLGVANPASSGLGGGAFWLIRSSKSHFEEKQQQQQSKQTNATLPEFVDAREENDPFADDPIFVTEVIDCREIAPGASSTDMYENAGDLASMVGGLAIAVPGELRGMELAHARHGRLPWSTVVEPALRLARDGFPVGRHLARDIHGFFTRFLPWIMNQTGGNITSEFADLRRYLSGGKDPSSNTMYLREGDLLVNPPLAQTLQEVSDRGADAFYTGHVAENLVRDVQASGGLLTVDDLNQYKPVVRSPVVANASGYTLVGVPPPSSGGATVIGIARFLEGYAEPLASNALGLSVHRMAEGMRHAFAMRMSLSDPAFGNSTKAAVADMISGGYMESLRKNTSDETVLPVSSYGGYRWAQLKEGEGISNATDAHEGDRRKRRHLRETNIFTDRHSSRQHRRRLAREFGYLDDNGTSHFSVVDGDGNSVAVTTSVNAVFGSLVYSDSTGVLMGNTMDDFGNPGSPNKFGLRPSPANFIKPGKRPLSSMSPTMVLHQGSGGGINSDRTWGDLVMVLGGSGGPKIITSVVQVVLNVLFLGMTLFAAVTRPRVHDQLLYHDAMIATTENAPLPGMHADANDGPILEVPERTKTALSDRNRRLLDVDYAGCVQAILVDHETNTLSAVSDMRKDGSPAGY